jgi:hypothetical protein
MFADTKLEKGGKEEKRGGTGREKGGQFAVDRNKLLLLHALLSINNIASSTTVQHYNTFYSTEAVCCLL